MTEPSRPRPVPGPPRPGPRPSGGPGPVTGLRSAGLHAQDGTAAPGSPDAAPFAGLGRRPVAEHVAVFEAEHARLQRELATIDQL
ncbi:hypothetical protein ACI782_18375 [Geodermatophilus sp. SYSU D00703]